MGVASKKCVVDVYTCLCIERERDVTIAVSMIGILGQDFVAASCVAQKDDSNLVPGSVLASVGSFLATVVFQQLYVFPSPCHKGVQQKES